MAAPFAPGALFLNDTFMIFPFGFYLMQLTLNGCSRQGLRPNTVWL